MSLLLLAPWGSLVDNLAARESNIVLLLGVIRVRLHASPFVKVRFEFSMNSYDESAGAIGTPHNATGTWEAKCLQNQLNKSSRTLKLHRNGWSKRPTLDV